MESPKHTLTFKPTICNSDAYSGTVTIRVPNYDERLELTERMGVDLADQFQKAKAGQGESVETADSSKMANAEIYQRMKFMSKIAHEYVLNVDITRTEDGYKFDSLEALKYDSEAGACISEIGGRVLGKYQVGKPQPS